MEQESYPIKIKEIYNRSERNLYLGTQYGPNPIKLKRKYIREAVNKLVEIDMIKKGKKEGDYIIPVKLFRPTRNQKPLQEFICKKIAKLELSKKKKIIHIKTSKKLAQPSGKERKLTEFFKHI